VLLCDGRLNGEQRGSLKQIRHCALQLLDLLKSILDLSKVRLSRSCEEIYFLTCMYQSCLDQKDRLSKP
jgi:signal transduction histidine kinase